VAEYPGNVASALLAWNLPRIQKFTGEKVHDEEGLKSFVKEFERHACLVGWSGEVKRLQFEVHLGGRALRMYESLKESQRQTYKEARDALMKVMHPVKVELYRHSRFNSRHQKEEETVSGYAEALQWLMVQAFARHRMDNEMRDKILLGQLEQGLLAKWKKHLKYPLETFEDGVSQARMAEAVEEQLLGGSSKGSPKGKMPKQSTPANPAATPASDEQEDSAPAKSGGQTRKPWTRCYNCKKKGHHASDCPGLQTVQQGGNRTTGAMRQRQDTSTSQVSTVQSTVDSRSLKERINAAKRECQELHLKRLQQITSAFSEDAMSVAVVSEAVGPRPYTQM
jgi:hypothetical protein